MRAEKISQYDLIKRMEEQIFGTIRNKELANKLGIVDSN